MKLNHKHHKSEDLSLETIANCLNDLGSVDSFFILERGNCSYLQCINYNEDILIEERVYSNDYFKHYVLGHIGCDNDSNDFYCNKLSIDDKFFKRFSNELFSIEEAIDIFTDYYSNIPFKNIVKRDVTCEFRNLEKGFVFIRWLESAVSNFKENLDEFVETIEPFIIDELKKDCVGRKILIKDKDVNKINENTVNDGHIKKKINHCSAFQVMDVHWAVESIVEVADKYGFLDDIILFKKNNLDDNDFFKLNIDDFK